MMGRNELRAHINYDWSAVNGLGQVVYMDENKKKIQKGIKTANAAIPKKLKKERGVIASWTPNTPMFNGSQRAYELAVAKYTAALDERERKMTLAVGDYIEEGQEYPMRGLFEHVPVTMVHGMFHHASEGGGILYTEDGRLSDGAHR